MVGAVSARRSVRGLLLSLSLGISILISILLAGPAVAAPLSQQALPQTAIRPAVVAPRSRLAHMASAANTAHGERAAGPLLTGEGFDPQFTGTCRSWTSRTDLNGYLMEWTPSNGGSNCANVNWYPSGPVTSGWCDYFLWVPSWDANANVYVGLFNASGTKYYGNTINENEYTDQRAYLGQFYDITQVTVGDNNGQTGTYIGIGAGSSPSLIADC